MDQIYPLPKISKYMLFKVLFKMPNISVCRMRQTTKFIDEFVEKNKIKMSSRAIEGFKMSIACEIRPTVAIITLSNDNKVVLSDYERQLSGICLEDIRITCRKNVEEDVKHQLAIIFRRFRPISNTMTFPAVIPENADCLTEISNYVTVKNKISFFCYGDTDDRILTALNSVQSTSNVVVDYNDAESYPKKLLPFLKSVTSFNFFNFDEDVFNVTVFQRLLWELYECEDFGRLKELFCFFPSENDEFTRPFPWMEISPPVTKLYDSSYVMQNAPNQIYMMKTTSSFCLISLRFDTDCVIVRIFIEEGLSGILDRVCSQIHVSSVDCDLREEFIEASPEEQMEIVDMLCEAHL